MTIHVEAATASTTDTQRKAAANELASHIKNVVGVSSKVNVSEPGSVERSLGKARRLIDNRS